MKHLLLADECAETHDMVLSFFKDEFKVLVPSSFEDILKDPFLKYFLAIVDHSFSDNKGFEVLQAIKKARPSLPVIFTATEYTEDLCLNISRLGVRDYFKKPFAIEDFVKNIWLISKIDNSKNSKVINKNMNRDLHEDYMKNSISHKTLQNIHPRVEVARKYIEQNYNKSLSLPFLAKIACMDKYHFCKTFKKQTGNTYTEYLKILRIRKAKELLLEYNALSITRIAYLVGYNDHSYFDRVFSCIEGFSPLSYRNKHFPPNAPKNTILSNKNTI